MDQTRQPEHDEPPRVATPAPPPAATPQQPDEVVDHEAVEVMSHTSPDGRPPEMQERSRSGLLFGVVATLVAAGVIVFLVAAGFATVGVALVFLVVLFAAAFPVWVAALLRIRERRRADDTARVVTRGWERQNNHGGLPHR